MSRAKSAIKVRSVDECCPSVLSAPLDAVAAAELATGFTALADPVRLRVLSMLADANEGEVCVCDFVGPLGKSQPTVSHHMKILSEAGLVQGEQTGQLDLVLAQSGSVRRTPGSYRLLRVGVTRSAG